LLQVAIHEFGHAIGLGHSEKREAIMWQYYSGFHPIRELPEDDLVGVHTLYGSLSPYLWHMRMHFDLEPYNSQPTGLLMFSDKIKSIFINMST